MNRRSFLKAMGYAAPTIFVPKLITVNWNHLRPTSAIEIVISNIRLEAALHHAREIERQFLFGDRTFHYTPKYAPLLLLKGGILPKSTIAPPAIAPQTTLNFFQD